jgi:hypothetical protein
LRNKIKLAFKFKIILTLEIQLWTPILLAEIPYSSFMAEGSEQGSHVSYITNVISTLLLYFFPEDGDIRFPRKLAKRLSYPCNRQLRPIGL